MNQMPAMNHNSDTPYRHYISHFRVNQPPTFPKSLEMSNLKSQPSKRQRVERSKKDPFESIGNDVIMHLFEFTNNKQFYKLMLCL